MTCVHLKKLFQLCEDNDIKLAGSELIHIICRECGEKEVCPSVLMDEYDAEAGGKPSKQAESKEPTA